ncbi:hypothetical protein B0T25DRAFT_552334 [Lasiosphaeria hispida]|uniref:Uncharacterized protein n=1 Tax=Lasiosphaeria hispida TaxID=260671 RepID=A0AAJ0HBK1_9PEZI|nr:hypothetical protein B0T25DRAFT_552334 [Lasiosphaeria hispida]
MVGELLFLHRQLRLWFVVELLPAAAAVQGTTCSVSGKRGLGIPSYKTGVGYITILENRRGAIHHQIYITTGRDLKMRGSTGQAVVVALWLELGGKPAPRTQDPGH